MRYLIQDFAFAQAQRGVVAEATISVATRRQSTNEMLLVRSGGRNLVTAAWNLWREMRRTCSEAQASSGKHDLSSSDFRCGLLLSRAD